MRKSVPANFHVVRMRVCVCGWVYGYARVKCRSSCFAFVQAFDSSWRDRARDLYYILEVGKIMALIFGFWRSFVNYLDGRAEERFLRVVWV